MPIPTLSPLSVVGDVDVTGNYRRNGSLLSAADVSAVALSLYGAKGSLAVGLSASVAAQLAVGSNGQVLTADSAQSHGVKWATVVTSVSMTVPSILSVSGSPVTSVGTLALSLATQSANTVFAGATSGGAATPTFRGLVAADIPSLDAGKIASGTIPISRGGTGVSSFVTGDSGSVVVRYNAGSGVLEPVFKSTFVVHGTAGSAPAKGVFTGIDVSDQTYGVWRATATGWSATGTGSRSPSSGMTLTQIIDVVRTLVEDLKNVGVLSS